MAGRLAFALARLIAAAVFILTWVYGVTALSPFAFDMFVKPRLFPWLETFVAWHHLWYGLAWLLTSATLLPVLARGPHGPSWRARAAWWVSVTYVAVFGAIGAFLLNAPRLPMLASGTQDPFVVPGALLPLCWLAIIDHLDGWPGVPAARPARVIGQQRLLATCLGSATVVWLSGAVRSGLSSTVDVGPAAWVLGGAWGLVILVTIFLGLYVLLSLTAALAAMTRRAMVWEYGLAVALMAALIAELFRRTVFPPLLLDARNAALTAAPLGVAVALTMAGSRIRAAGAERQDDTALDLLLSFRGRGITRAILLVAVPGAVGLASGFVGRIDWAMILGRLMAVIEAALVFGLLLDATRRLQRDTWSVRALVVPPVAAILALHAIPAVARATVHATGDGRADPRQLFDRYQTTAPLASLGGRAFVEQREAGLRFYRDLLEVESRLSALVPVPPAGMSLAVTSARATPPPHVFVFVIDSLRRDYLASYNDAVSFTPSIARWANDHFVFRNAFTLYGGTWLSIPSLWTGSTVTRRWTSVFSDINALERLIVKEGYDIVINDYTIADALRPETRRTFLDPMIPSVDTDLCRNLSSLQTHLLQRSSGQPVFAYLAPMNVHILNTRGEVIRPTGDYAGFYAPYASRLERIDSCFGGFIEFLRDRGLYDDSVIVLTSDHGDSLGDGGRWGHQFFLFPEDVRIPLIVQLPTGSRSQVTTDLGQVSFLTDITPTLYRLLGHPLPNSGPGFGVPLFVASDEVPMSRRRDSFLLMSSYGSSYGMLRRNGRFLYTVDLVNRREDVFTMLRNSLGEQHVPGEASRQVNQQKILERLLELEHLYGPASIPLRTSAVR